MSYRYLYSLLHVIHSFADLFFDRFRNWSYLVKRSTIMFLVPFILYQSLIILGNLIRILIAGRLVGIR